MEQSIQAGLQGADRKTTGEQVYEALRRGILGGAFDGGSRLVQSEIAIALGVSTTPVREALRKLAAEGLIRSDSYRGAVVETPTLEDAREIYKLRLLLEPVAAREKVEHLTRPELEWASELQRRMDQEKDLGSWVELNSQFHGVFEDASSPRMSAILRNLRDSAALIVGLSSRVRPALMTGSNTQHHLLLQACRNQDGDAAGRIVEQHLRETLESVERYFGEIGSSPAAEPPL